MQLEAEILLFLTRDHSHVIRPVAHLMPPIYTELLKRTFICEQQLQLFSCMLMFFFCRKDEEAAAAAAPASTARQFHDNSKFSKQHSSCGRN